MTATTSADVRLQGGRAIEGLEIRMRREGKAPGQIEDAIAGARIDRLRTGTCVRHLRATSAILKFARRPPHCPQVCVRSAASFGQATP